MLTNKMHPSDEVLLLFLDGELSACRTFLIRRHLLACWSCRTRAARAEAAIGEFMKMHELSRKNLPPVAGPRALLKARIAELSAAEGHNGWSPSSLRWNVRTLAYICALALVAAVGARIAISRLGARDKITSTEYAGQLPNPQFTPGVTRVVAISDICSMDHDEVVRPVSAALGQTVLDEYGLAHAPIEDYEIDYLITPGLGGADDIRNLWPQPRSGTQWNSFAKDQLEDRLHQLVCSSKLGLATAQKDVAKDWISAYKKYFRTTTPLPTQATVYYIRSKPSSTSLRSASIVSANFEGVEIRREWFLRPLIPKGSLAVFTASILSSPD